MSRLRRTLKTLVLVGMAILPTMAVLPAAAGQDRVSADQAKLKGELADIRRRIAELEVKTTAADEDWMSQRRAEQVRAVVRDVLNDADTRASLADGKPISGYDDGFYISPDPAWSLKINGAFQVRYLYDHIRDEDQDQDASGFQLRRTWLYLSGHVISPKVHYLLLTSFNRTDESQIVEIACITYSFDDHWSVNGGQIKMPFLREWQVSGRFQQGVERSYTYSTFTGLYTHGVNATYKNDQLNLMFSVNDGSHGWKTAFDSDRTDYALTGRAEWKLMGDWGEFSDFASFSGDPLGVLLGAAVDYEKGADRGSVNYSDVFKYTGDVMVQGGGWNMFAAYVGQHVTTNSLAGSSAMRELDQWSAQLQGGVFVVPDKLELYGRFEWMEFPDGGIFKTSNGTAINTVDNHVRIATLGGNWYFARQKVKLTLDVMYIFDALPLADSGEGLRASDHDGQVAIRTQLQVLF